MKVSTLFGKTAESADGKRGYIISVNVNRSRIAYLKCADENEREFAVETKNVTLSGEKITFKDGVNVMPDSRPLRLGVACVDENGNFLGVLEDVTLSDGKIAKAKIGRKNYPAEAVILGDVVIVRNAKKIKSDVIKDGRVILKKGTYLTGEALKIAEAEGQYIQASLKSI